MYHTDSDLFGRLTESNIESIVLRGIRRVSQTGDKPIGVNQVDHATSLKALVSLVSLADGDARTVLSLLTLMELVSHTDTANNNVYR